MFHEDGDVVDTSCNRQFRITVVSNDRSICLDTLEVGQLHIGFFAGSVVIEYHVTQDHVEVCFILQTQDFEYFRLQGFFLSGLCIVAGSERYAFVACQCLRTQIPDAFYLFHLDQSRIG